MGCGIIRYLYLLLPVTMLTKKKTFVSDNYYLQYLKWYGFNRGTVRDLVSQELAGLSCCLIVIEHTKYATIGPLQLIHGKLHCNIKVVVVLGHTDWTVVEVNEAVGV